MGDKDLKEVKKTPLKEHSHNTGEKFVKNSLKAAITSVESGLKEADRQAGLDKTPGADMPGVAARKSVDAAYKGVTAAENQIKKIRDKNTYEKKLKRNLKANEVENMLKGAKTRPIGLRDKNGNTHTVDFFNIKDYIKMIKDGDIEVESIEKNPYQRNKDLKTKDKMRGVNHDDKFSRASKNRLQKMKGTDRVKKAVSEKEKFELKKRAEQMREAARELKERVKETIQTIAKTTKRVLSAMAQFFSNPVVLIILGVCIALFFLINLIVGIVTGNSFIFTTQQQKNDEMEALTADMTYSEYQYQLARDLLEAGFEPDDIAAMFGSFIQESKIQPTAVQPDTMEDAVDQGKLPDTITTTQAYIDGVNSGAITKEQFINDGVGFGIGQWTFPSRKKALYEFAQEYSEKHHSPFSLTSYYVQYEYLLYELTEKTDWIGGHGKTMKELLEAAPADPNKEHNKAWVFAKRFENPKHVEQVRITNYQMMRPYVQIVKNGGDGGGNYTVLNTRYFYQKGSGPCWVCSMANLWFRFFYQRKAENWAGFNAECKVELNGTRMSMYEAMTDPNTDEGRGVMTATWVGNGAEGKHTGWNTRNSYSLTYGGVTGTVKHVSGFFNNKSELVAFLAGHSTGVVVYSSYGSNKRHGILLTRYDSKEDTFYYVDPAQGTGQEYNIKEQPDQVGIVTKIQNENYSNIKSYDYIE